MALRSGSRNLKGIFETCNRLGWISTGCIVVSVFIICGVTCDVVVSCILLTEVSWDGISEFDKTDDWIWFIFGVDTFVGSLFWPDLIEKCAF